MHIAFILQRYNPYGGAERFLSRALAALVKTTDLEVSLVARDWEPIDGIKFIRCDPFYLGRLWRDRSFARQACQRLKAIKPDLIQSNERVECCDIFRAGDGIRRVWLEQRAKNQSWPVKLYLRISPYHNYVKRLEKRLLENPRLRAVICNSKMVRAEILQYFQIDESKIHVIYNGVDIDRFNPRIKQQNSEIRKSWHIPDEANVFTFVGSGYERKGLLQTLKAFAGLPENCYLVVAGRDKRERHYRKAAGRLGIGGRVKFLGPLKDVLPCYTVADAFVFPTLYDPFPNVALEAMACGLPVITSTKSGAAEFIEDKQNGFICDALDIAGIENSMKALCDKALARKMGTKSRIIMENYDLSAMAEKLADLYKSLLSQRC